MLMDAMQLEFDEASFDVVTAFEVIEHLPDFRRFLGEVHRVLKLGGVFMVSTPNKLITSPGLKRPLHPPHFHEFYCDEFYNVLEDAGFAVQSLCGQNRKQIRTGIAKAWYIAKSWTLGTIYPWVPTAMIKFYKNRRYSYEPDLQMAVTDRYQVQQANYPTDFQEGDMVYAVMVAVCSKAEGFEDDHRLHGH